MYIVVNSSVKMSRGKAAAQVAHVAADIAAHMYGSHPAQWRAYANASHPKVVLKAKGAELERLAKHPMAFSVRDEGRTEIEPGTLTAVGFAPGCDDVDLSSFSLL